MIGDTISSSAKHAIARRQNDQLPQHHYPLALASQRPKDDR